MFKKIVLLLTGLLALPALADEWSPGTITTGETATYEWTGLSDSDPNLDATACTSVIMTFDPGKSAQGRATVYDCPAVDSAVGACTSKALFDVGVQSRAEIFNPGYLLVDTTSPAPSGEKARLSASCTQDILGGGDTQLDTLSVTNTVPWLDKSTNPPTLRSTSCLVDPGDPDFLDCDWQQLTEKVAPVAGDHLLIEDSEDGASAKRVQIGNLPASTYTESVIFESPIAADDLRWKAPAAITLVQLDCVATGGVVPSGLGVSISVCDGNASSCVASGLLVAPDALNTNFSDTTATESVGNGDWWGMDIVAVTASPDYLHCTVEYTR